MKKHVKWVLWGVATLALIAIFAYSATRPLKAELLELSPRTIENKFTESGTVSAAWQRDFFSVLSGKVLSVYVNEGDAVSAGALLLALDTRDIDLKIAQLEGQLLSLQGQETQALAEPRESQIAQQRLAVQNAETQLSGARAELERAQTVYSLGGISKSTLEEAERAVTQLEILLAQQEQALRLLQEESGPLPGTKETFSGQQASIRAQIALLEYQRQNAMFKTPTDATVSTVLVKEGAVVAPGTPLLSVFKPSEYEIEVFLLPEDVVNVLPGMKVDMHFRGPGKGNAFKGVVRSVAPTAVQRVSALGLVEQRVRVNVGITSNPDSLRAGYALDVTFVVERQDNQIVVPKTALFNHQGQSSVWVVRGGKAQIQSVQKGLESDDEVAIVSGLSSGDTVVRNPRLDGLKPGARVAQR